MAKSYPTPTKFIPTNPGKYVGDATNIISRSSWERKVMKFFDTSPSILRWSSEETIIPYFSPVDKKNHRYFLDFTVMYKTRTGEIKRAIVEVKPEVQTLPPKKPKRQSKRYIEEVCTYQTNKAKWLAAEEWAKQKQFSFLILTEKHLGV
jgi:hypothetical protein